MFIRFFCSSLVLILKLSISNNVACTSKLSIYSSEGDDPPLVIDGQDCPFGVELKSSFSVTCACITGLWAFYDNTCDGPSKIVGAVEEKCIFLNQTMAKVHMLSAPDSQKQTASVFMDDRKRLIGRLEFDITKTNSIDIPTSRQAEFLLSSGANDWRLEDNKCLRKNQPVLNTHEYCYYRMKEADVNPQTKLSANCNTPDVDKISSESCIPYITSHSPECSEILKQSDRFARSDDSGDKHTGRTFMRKVKTGESNATATEESKGNGTDSKFPEYHEDRNLTANMTFPEMNSQIWNYLTSRALEILNLTSPKIQTPLTPTFKFLDLSKRIMQKACPNHYVKDNHFDLALQTFMNLQKKNFNFNDAFSDYAAKQRIEDSLYLCLQNITAYPFVDPLNRSAENCNETVELGTFEKFGQMINLNVSWGSSGREREPLIETVWKIFTHTHTACYRYFEEVGFNDHHRFTSAVMPVFTNEINDIWKSMTELSQEPYSGLLGDPIKLMDGVTYCSEFAKLDTEYPWEIPRPEKELSKRRRKRSVTGDETCLREDFDNKCNL